MRRLLIVLSVLVAAVFGPMQGASAEMMRPDLGMGATDYFSKMAMSQPGAQLQFIAPPVDMPPLNGRMAISPQLLLQQHRAVADAARAEATWNFWTYVAILSAAFLGGAYLLGRMVLKRGWKVGYTRKGQALVLYFLPYVAMQGPSPYSPIVTASVSLGVFVALLMLMSAPFRTRIPALATAFAAIDRPEDRPFTLTWLITSVIAAWGILCAWMWFAPETTGYLFVALFISGVGDALAEPVGLYFGKHSYRTKALGTTRTYIRTYEGSAAVFLSGVVAVLIVHGFVLDTQALIALALFSVAGTIAEAKAPHTWDQPFIIGSSALVAVGLSMA